MSLRGVLMMFQGLTLGLYVTNRMLIPRLCHVNSLLRDHLKIT